MCSILRCLSNPIVRLLLLLCLGAPFSAHAQLALQYGSGDLQSGAPNTTLSTPLVVQLLSSDPAFSGKVDINWQVLAGTAGIVESGGATTYTQSLSVPSAVGLASQVHIALGATLGKVTVRASCQLCKQFPGSTSQIDFNLTISAPTLQIVSGDGQAGAAYNPGTAPLLVQLTNNGTPVPNQTVTWSVISGQATLVAATTQTGSTGRSANQFTYAGPGPIVIQARAAGSLVQFHATAAALVLTIVSGDGQSGAAGTAATSPLVVRLTSAGVAVADQTVSWNLVSGPATLSATTSQTDSNGQASIDFIYGAGPGQITIAASVSNSQVAFRETALAATLLLTKVSGDNQSGAAGTSNDAPLVVKLTSNGQPAANQLVEWIVDPTRISVGDTSGHVQIFTDANGLSSLSFIYISAGTSTIMASSAGGNVSFTVTGFVPTASVISGNNQTAAAGTTLQPFVIQLGQPAAAAMFKGANRPRGLGQVPVSWTVVQGGGTLTSAQTLTDASGRSSNTLKLGPSAGVNVVQALVEGTTLTFTATATSRVPADSKLSITGGSTQNLVPLKPSDPLIVKLVDAQGQPVPGIDIQWSVSGATGTLASTTTTTDANGQAQNQLTVVLPGSYTVTAKIADAPDVAPVTFGFNNGVVNLSGLTPAEIAVAHAIDVACPALATSPTPITPPQQDFLARCSEVVVRSGTNPAQVPSALDAMLNNKSLPQRNLAQGVQMGQYGNLNTRLTELRQGVTGVNLGGLSLMQDGRSLPLATLADLFRKDPQQNDEVGKDFERWGFFATGMIQRGGFSAVDEQPGFDFHNASLTAGVDYRVNADFVAGVALGYNSNHSSLDADQGKVDVDGYSLNGYFTWYRNDFYVEGSAVLGWLSYDLRRHINYQIDSLASSGGFTTIDQTANASPDGRQNSLSLSFGKDFNRQAWTFSPYLRGIYTHLSLDGFSETLSDPTAPGGGLGTSVEGRSLSSALGVIGGRVSYAHSYDWGVLVPNALLEWNHEFRNDAQNVVTRFLADPTQTPIVLTDTPPDSNYFNIGFGLNAVLPKGRSGFVYFEHLAGYSGAHENRLSIGIRVEF